MAVKAKSLLKKYRWKTGGGYHFGVGAQSLVNAFTEEGLNWKEYDIIRYEDDRYAVSYSDLLAFILIGMTAGA